MGILDGMYIRVGNDRMPVCGNVYRDNLARSDDGNFRRGRRIGRDRQGNNLNGVILRGTNACDVLIDPAFRRNPTDDWPTWGGKGMPWKPNANWIASSERLHHPSAAPRWAMIGLMTASFLMPLDVLGRIGDFGGLMTY